MSTVSCQTNFTAGQISPHIFGRGDLSIFENGARRLENVIIHPTGGVSRRCGTRYIDEISSKARLIPFEFNTEQTYLVCITTDEIKIYQEDECIASLESPWTEKQLFEINYTQSADTLLIVHPDVPPKQILRLAEDNWKISDWEFYEDDKKIRHCPYFNYYRRQVRLHFEDFLWGRAICVAESPVFDESYIGEFITFRGGYIKITDYISEYRVAGDTLKDPSAWDSTLDWAEAAFSPRRGWPSSVTFHQNRMVIGGSKSLPNRLWLSKSSDLFNFDLGKGLDDDSIEFGILSDQVNAIKGVVSSRHLLIFTTGAEYMVTGEPLAPASIQLKRQTNVGSYNVRTLMPQQADGATLFISNSGTQLREFLYTDVEQAYMAADLTLLSSDIISNPVDSIFNQYNNILYVVLEDGTISSLTSYRTEQVKGWSKIITNGKFISITVSGEKVYTCVQRNDKYFIEVFDDKMFVDGGIKLESSTPKTLWNNLNHLEGQKVSVVTDGFNGGTYVVQNGSIELLNDASSIQVGYSYEHAIEPLPHMVNDIKPYPPKAYRIISGIFRIINSGSFRIDIGSGYVDVPLRKLSENKIFSDENISYSGDVKLRSIGWIRDMEKSPWIIKSEEPLPFTLLSVTTNIKQK